MSKVITVPVTTLTTHEKLAKTLNEVVSGGRNVEAIFFNRDSFMKGHYEIIASEPQVIIQEVEKIIEKEVIKEVPLKIVNQVKKQRGASSQYRGVCKKGDRWYAMIQVNKKKHWCGSYFHEVLAAEAYDKKAIELLGTNAVLNFPENYTEVANG